MLPDFDELYRDGKIYLLYFLTKTESVGVVRKDRGFIFRTIKSKLNKYDKFNHWQWQYKY